MLFSSGRSIINRSIASTALTSTHPLAVIVYPPTGQGQGQGQGQGPPVDAAEVRRRLGMGVCAIEAVVNGIQGAVIGCTCVAMINKAQRPRLGLWCVVGMLRTNIHTYKHTQPFLGSLAA
jgi:hypothetical protein